MKLPNQRQVHRLKYNFKNSDKIFPSQLTHSVSLVNSATFGEAGAFCYGLCYGSCRVLGVPHDVCSAGCAHVCRYAPGINIHHG